MMTKILLLLCVTCLPARAECLSIAGERILAGDIARAVPAFAAIAPELVLGYAPAPGARRSFGAAELARLAHRYGLIVEPGTEACFVRPLETLTRDRVAAALRAAMPTGRIEIVEFSRQPVPPGELRFSLAGLAAEQSTKSPLLWRGVVSKSGQADFPVWAKVRLQVAGKRVISTQALVPGRAIERTQLREESYEGQPGMPDLSQVVGRAPRRLIPEGTVIETQWLSAPADVLSGERVRVEVRSGSARVFLEGQAQSSGRRGEVIGVRNPANGRIFRATVADRGRVALAAYPGETIPIEGANR